MTWPGARRLDVLSAMPRRAASSPRPTVRAATHAPPPTRVLPSTPRVSPSCVCGHPFRIVSSSLLVCRSELEEAILDVVIGGNDAAYLYKKSKRGGGAMPTRMYDDLLALIAHFDPAARARGDSEVVHYCCVLPGSAEESRGLPTGGPCCADVRESVEKTAAAWLNFIAGRGWARSAESRWTNITTNAKRLVVVVNLLGGAIDVIKQGGTS